jgi:hypothetical protein
MPKIHTEKVKVDRVQHSFITLNQSTSLQHMPGTSPSGLNQTERKRLEAAPCKRGELHIRRHLERRKSPSPPIRRCRSRSPALCQRNQDLPEAGRSCQLPNKEAKAVYVLLCEIYSYFGYRRLKQSSEATYKVSRDMQ